MGLTRARVRLANARRPDLAAVEIDALADTGALHLCIPVHVAIQLQLDELEKREVTVAEGSKQLVPYVGPVVISFANRQCYAGAMVLGDEALLGAIPMEDMDLVVLPAARQVAVNPANPNIAVSIAKGLPPAPSPPPAARKDRSRLRIAKIAAMEAAGIEVSPARFGKTLVEVLKRCVGRRHLIDFWSLFQESRLPCRTGMPPPVGIHLGCGRRITAISASLTYKGFQVRGGVSERQAYKVRVAAGESDAAAREPTETIGTGDIQ